jgi:hypothetical protein
VAFLNANFPEKSRIIAGRTPFAKDKILDYDLSSEDEA